HLGEQLPTLFHCALFTYRKPANADRSLHRQPMTPTVQIFTASGGTFWYDAPPCAPRTPISGFPT
ncbi:hypothetical protein, partial [Aeromonas caviae]|uniref:hypothetical protein n=1 Tax=Aeromonas caviae TaxID=648 RepID=UPI001F3BC452